MTINRIADSLRRADAHRRRLLVIYLTLGDPLLGDPADAARAAVDAGADVLELGIPTPATRPRGSEMSRSFARARGIDPGHLWGLLHDLREATPVPLLPLIYPETIDDLGWAGLLRDAAGSGADGLVLTRPDGPHDVERVSSAGLSAIPVIPATGHASAAGLERAADHLTYRRLAPKTGDPLDLEPATRLAARLAATAAKPFLVGFGIKEPRHIRALALHAAGVVLGSRVLELLAATGPHDRLRTLQDNIRRWRTATFVA